MSTGCTRAFWFLLFSRAKCAARAQTPRYRRALECFWRHTVHVVVVTLRLGYKIGTFNNVN